MKPPKKVSEKKEEAETVWLDKTTDAAANGNQLSNLENEEMHSVNNNSEGVIDLTDDKDKKVPVVDPDMHVSIPDGGADVASWYGIGAFAFIANSRTYLRRIIEGVIESIYSIFIRVFAKRNELEEETDADATNNRKTFVKCHEPSDPTIVPKNNPDQTLTATESKWAVDLRGNSQTQTLRDHLKNENSNDIPNILFSTEESKEL